MLFGRPQMLQPDRSYCILHHEGFISAYSHEAFMPLWSSFTVAKPVSVLVRAKTTTEVSDSVKVSLFIFDLTQQFTIRHFFVGKCY